MTRLSSLLLFSFFIVLSKPSKGLVIHHDRIAPQQSDVFKVGVTAILNTPEHTIVGTKKGGLFVQSHRSQNATLWMELVGYLSRFPVYSLTAGTTFDGQPLIFAGMGDRHVSVWRANGRSFEYQQKLGPHTGWVKDVAFRQSSNSLYSIGCNCIETWQVPTDPVEASEMFHHVTKRSIENSPEQGSTLSSDLLCLCALKNKKLLLSGGVDGRIHVWSENLKIASPLYSTRVHGGRVSAIDVSSDTNTIFSVAYDGRLVASTIDTDGVISEQATLELMGTPRLTAICIWDSQVLVLGTADGVLVQVGVSCDNNGCLVMTEEKRLELSCSPMIYSLCSTRSCSTDSDSPVGAGLVLVGHASGMAKVTLE